MTAAMRARASSATTTRTTAAATANQNAQACSSPRRRGTTSSRANSSADSTPRKLSAFAGRVWIAAADPEQDLVLADALELALARQLRPVVAVLAELVLELRADDHRARPRLVGDAACQVDRRAEPVAGARQALAKCHPGAHRRELLALRLDALEQVQQGLEQRARLRRHEHGRVADHLDQAHRRLRDVCRQRRQTAGDTAELVGRHLLAE